MIDKLRQIKTSRILTALAVITAFGLLGTYLLASSQAQSPETATRQNDAPGGPSAALLQPADIGFAPYQYIAYSGSLEQTRAATGTKNYFAAFIISDGTCAPAWGGTAVTGLASPRSSAIAADIEQVRAAGAEVTISFGGSHGVELATACTTVESLTDVYRSVIDTYGVSRIDLDIEGPALADTAGMARRTAAIDALQQALPELQIWVTLPAHSSGLTPPGLEIIRQLQTAGVAITGVNIMAMNYNIGSKDMGRQAIVVADKTFDQLRELYPNNSDDQIWQALGITVMVGRNDTSPETFTLEDARQVKTYADGKNIGMLSIWNASRDVQCPDGNAGPQPSVSCSGVDQQPNEFTKILAGAP